MRKRLPECVLPDNKENSYGGKISPHLRKNPDCADCGGDRPEYVCTRCGVGFCSLCNETHCCCGKKIEPILEDELNVLHINTELTGERFADGSGWKLDSNGVPGPRSCGSNHDTAKSSKRQSKFNNPPLVGLKLGRKSHRSRSR